MYIFSYLLDYRIIYEKIIKSLVCWSHLDSYRRVFVCLFLFVCLFVFFLQDFWNLILMIHVSSTHTFPVNNFNLEGGETMLAQDKLRKFPCPRQESNSRPPGSVVGTSDFHIVFGGSWVQFSPRVRKFFLSRASMVSPPSKLKMFTGSVCVLLTSVSLKLTKIKIKLIYATTSSWEKKQNGGWKLRDTDWFYFSF